jgi:hypothetical protein
LKTKNKKRKILKFELLSLDYQDVCDVFETCETEFHKNFFDPKLEEQIKEQEEAMKKREEKDKENNAKEKEKKMSDSTDIQSPNKQEQSSEKESSELEVKEEKISKKVVRKLFRAIALETHPDALYGEDADTIEYKESLYKKAARAAKKGKEYELLEIAVSLGITDILNDTEIYLLLDKAMMNLKNKVHQLKNSIMWLWYHANGKQKNILEIQIQKQLGLKKRDE